jgi:GNAT superfamily N-acetyltransferase
MPAVLQKIMHMKIEVKYDCQNIDWEKVSEILKSVGMTYYSPEKHKAAFESSYCTIFLYDNDRLVGFGRAISDRAYQAAVYDCAVVEEYQGHGFGKLIMQEILSKLPACNVILYASPGKEAFYEKQGFKRMKTGMACFINREYMAKRGFTE